MTECVPVPSSEHVAEIVGRQGCKIKALRAKTNTYIKTPVRGEEPVFVVTGRKEDVAKAKREILSAAEHFSQIRASRKNNLSGGPGSLSPPGPPANVPGHVTIQVRVPYRVVGLVVGPKGATIKRIQHQTHTYIVTPSRDKEPVFDVTGLPESVEAAKREIEAHIAVRTGTGTVPDSLFAADASSFLSNTPQNLLNDLYKSGIGSLFSYMDNLLTDNTTVGGLSSSSDFSAGSSGCSSASSSSSASGTTGLADLGSIWSMSLDRDEGIGESPSFETATASSSIWSFPSTTRPSPPQSASPAESITGGKRECVVCGEREVTAALVPCGHNFFCMDCGERLCQASEPTCPVCTMPVCQAIRIIS
ncbi:RNA-binding E3 ubiquitin-protein ligase MEX3C [Lycorma delicatula]|uniref:RNA-binding E3 ubiquitin-protein ligase MEX3C n=1 Tax=Lycorma delicatula TaxID=130591 RepID=UPI003F50FEC3